MAHATRILLVCSEVTPFVAASELADLTRALPDRLCQQGDYDVRIMMPRYGTISEWENRLHDVIRLSGTEVPMGKAVENLDVKVATIPDTRLQVYFMNNATYFEREGIYANGDAAFEDNPERALFFGRAALETICKLRWAPDVIHAFGALSGLVPMLLRTEFADEELYEHTQSVYTPEQVDVNLALTSDWADRMSLSLDGQTGRQLTEVGTHHADAVLYPSHLSSQYPNGQQLDAEEAGQQTAALYEEMLSEVAS